MRARRVFASKLRSVTKRTRDDEFAAEIDSLIEMHAADHRRAGSHPPKPNRWPPCVVTNWASAARIEGWTAHFPSSAR